MQRSRLMENKVSGRQKGYTKNETDTRKNKSQN